MIRNLLFFLLLFFTSAVAEVLGTPELPYPPFSKGVYKKSDLRSASDKIKNLTFLNGDLVFIRSTSAQSKALEEVTQTRWTHVGILFRVVQQGKNFKLVSSKEKLGNWYVLEANSRVQLTPLKKFVVSKPSAFFRLKNSVTENQASLLFQAGLTRIGKFYDLFFLLSRDGIHKDEFDYCSELVWYVFAKALRLSIGERVLIEDLPIRGNEAQKLLKKRFDEKAPLSFEKWKKQYVIPPQSLFESPLLRRIDL
jgi:hypothetical protein